MFTTTVDGAAAYERLQHPIASADMRGEVSEALAAVALAKDAVEGARSAFVASVEAARVAGATNQEIGDVLGVTRQRVSQLLKEEK